MNPETRDRLAFAFAFVVGAVVAVVSLHTFGVWFFTLARHGFDLTILATLPLFPLGLAATSFATYAVASRLLGEPPADVRRRRGMRLATLVTAAVFLAVASAGVPERVDDPADLDELTFGFPVPYLVQRPSHHSYERPDASGHTEGVPLPALVLPFSPLEHGSDIRWWALALDVAALLGGGLLVRRGVTGAW
jgi:hypothetical protein